MIERSPDLAVPQLHSLPSICRMAMISVHTSPIAMLGGKDAGGLNVYVRELSRKLGDLGVEVDIFTRRSDPDTPEVVEIADRVRVVTINAGPAEDVPKDEVFSLLTEFSSEVALYSLRAGLRYDVMHSHYWLSGWAAHLLSRYWNAPVAHTFHTLARLKNAASGAANQESQMRVLTEARLLKLVDSIIAPNPDERAEMIWRMGADNARICVVPPGIDLDRFQPQDPVEARRRLALPENPLVLFIGRVDPIKGIDTLLDGFAELRRRDWPDGAPKLVFVGGTLEHGGPDPKLGSDLRSVASRAEALGIRDDILFRGSEPQEILPDYYAAATVCAVTSLYESFGLVAVEAMACGLPVVASRAGGMKFTVEEDVSGLLFPVGDGVALADNLERVIRDRDFRASLQVGARQAAVRFSWQSIAPTMLSIYERLAEGERDNLCCTDTIYAS